jgi:hypothetical protein
MRSTLILIRGAFTINLAELSEKEFDVDQQRAYLSGHSIGGAGALPRARGEFTRPF